MSSENVSGMVASAIPESMTAEKLERIATMLDLMDVILDKIEFKVGEKAVNISSLRGQEMQADLRAWAAQIGRKPEGSTDAS